MGLGHRMLQPSPNLLLKSFMLTGVKAALFLLLKCSLLNCRKWLHKKLFHTPAAKLYFCPGSHHTVCQCSARHLLLGLLPSPQVSVWNQSCERWLWSYNNFISWILHHSVSSGPVGTVVFSGNLLLWKGAHPMLPSKNSDFAPFHFLPLYPFHFPV